MSGYLIRHNREWDFRLRADATGPEGLGPAYAAALARLDTARVPA